MLLVFKASVRIIFSKTSKMTTLWAFSLKKEAEFEVEFGDITKCVFHYSKSQPYARKDFS